jgi:threonine dehydrogenase-like Zn-dependent dehydrogenase
MNALVLRSGELRIDHVADPTPGSGQLIVRSLACCICASDLHMVHHSHRLAAWSRDHGGPFDFDPDADVVLGHEVCGEVVDVGPGCESRFEVGDRVVTQPLVFHDSGFAVLGYSNEYPGGFAEYLAVSESLALAVPGELTTTTAALMEPLSVGVQYARIGAVQPGEVPLVIGCGAIGLAVIAALRMKGVSPIVAADLSPFRRGLAIEAGATEAVDPREESAVAAWTRVAPGTSRCVIWECVGAPGVLNGIFTEAPWESRIIVAGQNLDDDIFFTASAHTKGLNVQFGGSPLPSDYQDALTALATGAVDVGPWQTGHVDLDGAVAAFEDSTNASTHARIAIHPNGVEAAGITLID